MPTWAEVQQTLPPDLPDVAYDALLEKFYAENVRPRILREGLSDSASWQEFKRQAARPGKTSASGLAVAATQAVKALAAPLRAVRGAEPATKTVEEAASWAQQEHEKQGGSVTGWQMLGEVAGTLPYWIPAFKGANALAKVATGLKAGPELVQAQRIFQTAAGGLTQGAYDAAKADEGHRMEGFVHGTLVGGTLAAGFEFGPTIAKVLLGRGHTPKQVEATLSTLKGTATPEQEAIHASTLAKDPEINTAISQAAQVDLAAAKANGTPKVVEVAGRKNLKLVLRTADGKAHHVGGVTGVSLEQFEAVTERLQQHLAKGASIELVEGDPAALRNFWGFFEAKRKTNGTLPAVVKDVQGQPTPLPELPIDPVAEKPLVTEAPSLPPSPETLPAVQAITDTIPVEISPKPGYNEAEQKLIMSLKKVVTDPNLSAAQKAASRLRLGRLSPETLAEVDAKLSAASAPSPAASGEPSIPSASGPNAELAAAQEKSRALAAAKGEGTAPRTETPFEGAFTSVSKQEERRAAKEAMKGQQIDIDDISLSDGLEVLPNGKVRDKLSGNIYVNAAQALQAQGKVRFAAPENWEPGEWISPTGKIEPLQAGETHALVAERQFSRRGKEPQDVISGRTAEGWVRVRGDSVEFDSTAASPQALMTAVGKAGSRGQGVYLEDEVGRSAFLRKESFPEFFDNPRKWMMQNKGRFAFEDPVERRGFLKTLLGGAAGAVEPQKITAALKAAEAGNQVAASLFHEMTGWPIAGFGKGFVKLKIPLGDAGKETTVVRSPNAVVRMIRELEGDHDIISTRSGLLATIRDLPKLAPSARKELLAELDSLSKNDFYDLMYEISEEASWGPEVEKLLPKRFTESIDQFWAKEEVARLEQAASDKKLAEKWKKEEVDAAVAKAKERRLQQQTVTPGTELQRTPLQLGEEGQGGILQRYAIDHSNGETIPNTAQSKPTPLYDRQIISPEGLPRGVQGVTYSKEGTQPRIEYVQGALSPKVITHETHHALIGTLGLNSTVDDLIRNDLFSMGEDLLGAFSPRVRQFYKDAWPEEIWTHLAAAVRHRDQKTLDAFAAADTDEAHLLDWFGGVVDEVRRAATELPDSLHKRVFERKLNDLTRRATSRLDKLSPEIEAHGDTLHLTNGKFTIETKEGVRKVFTDRYSLADYVEKNYQEPLNSPNLVDETHLPSGVPRYSIDVTPHNLSRAPIQTNPQGPNVLGLPSEGRIKGGASGLSFFVRPFYSWLDTVAKKNNWPELYNTFKHIDDQMASRNAFVEKWEQTLRDILTHKGKSKYDTARRSDLYRYMEAEGESAKAEVAQALRLTPEEISDAARLKAEFYDPLFSEFGINGNLYIQDYAPRMRLSEFNPDSVKPGNRLSSGDVDFFAEHIRSGELDPRDTDLLRVSHAYLQLGARKKFLGEALEQAAELNNLKTSTGEFVTGSLQPLLKRHIDYIKTSSDYSQRLIDSTVNSAIEMISNGIEKVNSKLPQALKLESLQTYFDNLEARDALGKWILFSYAGGLGLRPMVPLRDSMQLLLTTYPMLGGRYLATGLKAAMRPGARDVADQYGALIHHADLSTLYSAGGDTLAKSRVTQAAEAMLRPLQWSNNSNRLVAFWGHAERALDAFKELRSDPQKLAKASGLYQLDSNLRNQYLKEIAEATTHDQLRDISFRAARDLTDISQWNYRRGAMPGIYKYALGRLFGQYGTWPLNYIEYARRLASSGEAGDRVQALTRLVLAHGAVLKTMESAGVDAGQWVFTQPAAYGGSPIFNSVMNIPGSFDFETYKGAEARRQVVQPIWPLGVPGGLAAQRIHKAITENDPNLWQAILGFRGMKDSEYEQGVHQLPPPTK